MLLLPFVLDDLAQKETESSNAGKPQASRMADPVSKIIVSTNIWNFTTCTDQVTLMKMSCLSFRTRQSAFSTTCKGYSFMYIIKVAGGGGNLSDQSGAARSSTQSHIATQISESLDVQEMCAQVTEVKHKQAVKQYARPLDKQKPKFCPELDESKPL